ncbi:CDP-alcohol phosphatidyltransferase family protein [Enterococcus sp. C50]|uniref:CDP-alcohol phosphatidyltransferase family protein n=1 Tax=Enterococcus sp. C50 TaxID=3231311 RepID=UPI0034A04BF0
MKITQNWREEIKTIPNGLSLFRIVLLPVYLYFVWQRSFYLAGLVIAVSGLTDFLDGYIARRFNQITELGKLLDPLSDKLTQFVLILSMAWYRPWIWLLLGLFVIKEGFMMIAGIIGLKHGVKLSGAKWYGKLATAVIYLGMIILLVCPQLAETWVSVIFGVIAICLMLSFVLYALEYRKMLRSTKLN